MPIFSLKNARDFYKNKQYGPAVANYMSVLKYYPDKAYRLEAEFLDCFKHFCEYIYQSGPQQLIDKAVSDNTGNGQSIDDINDYFLLLSDIYSDSAQFFCQWGDFLLNNGLHEEAALCYMKSLAFVENDADGDEDRTSNDKYKFLDLKSLKYAGKKPSSIVHHTRRALNELRDQLVDQWHFRMLNDESRNKAYSGAIKKAVEKLKAKKFASILVEGTVRVLDIGCGTGILSMAAVKHGATRVYAVGRSRIMCHIAERVLVLNEMKARIKLIDKDSFDLTVEDLENEKVDLIVTELMDAGFFGENIVECILDAKNRFLCEDGLVIPCDVTVHCAFVESYYIQSEYSTLSNALLAGHINLSKPIFSTISAQGATDFVGMIEPYDSKILSATRKNSYRFLSEDISVFRLNLNDMETLSNIIAGLKTRFTVEVTASGSLNAIVSWFTVDLIDNITLSSNPAVKSCWEQAIFPVQLTKTVSIGDLIHIEAEVKHNWLSIKPEVNLMNATDRLAIDTGPLLSINDEVTLNTYRLFFEACSSTMITRDSVGLSVLDLTADPVSPILFCMINPTCTVRSINVDCAAYCSRLLLEDNPSVNGRMQLHNPLSFDKTNLDQKIDLMIINPLDNTNGLLKPNALEDIAFYKLKFGPDVILPNRMDLWGQLVESDDILTYCKVKSDQMTLGFNIEDAVNTFYVECLRDLEVTTLKHVKACEKSRILSIDFQSPISDADVNTDPTTSTNVPSVLYHCDKIEVKCETECRIDALIFWFNMSCSFCAGVSLDTLNPDNRYCQAAYVLKNSINVRKNDVVVVEVVLKKSSLKFNVFRK